MPSFPFFPFYAADWLTSHRNTCLSLAEQGAHIRLLSLMWLSGTCSLPDDLDKLGRMVGLNSCLANDEQMLSKVRAMFVQHPTIPQSITSERLYKEWVKAVSISEARSEAARKPRKRRLNNSSTLEQQEPSKQGTKAYTSTSTSSSSSSSKKKTQKNSCKVPLAGVPAAAGSGVDPPAKTAAVWQAYAEAYEQRYHVIPTRNAKVNSQLAQFVTRVPLEEAPEIAQFYVEHPEKFYLLKQHPVWILLRDAEGLRTQWQAKIKITSSTLTQVEKQAQITSAMQAFKQNHKGSHTHDAGQLIDSHTSPHELSVADGHYAHDEPD